MKETSMKVKDKIFSETRTVTEIWYATLEIDDLGNDCGERWCFFTGRKEIF